MAADERRSGKDRQRVLVEDPFPEWQDLLRRVLDPDEYELAFCDGPRNLSGDCPLLSQGTCPKAEWADCILHSLDAGDPRNQAVIAALRHRYPGTVIAVLDGDPPEWSVNPRHRPGLLPHR